MIYLWWRWLQDVFVAACDANRVITRVSSLTKNKIPHMVRDDYVQAVEEFGLLVSRGFGRLLDIQRIGIIVSLRPGFGFRTIWIYWFFVV